VNEMWFQRKYGFAWIFSREMGNEMVCDPSFKEPYGGFRLVHSIVDSSAEAMGSCFFYPRPWPILKLRLNLHSTDGTGIRLAGPRFKGPR